MSSTLGHDQASQTQPHMVLRLPFEVIKMYVQPVNLLEMVKELYASFSIYVIISDSGLSCASLFRPSTRDESHGLNSNELVNFTWWWNYLYGMHKSVLVCNFGMTAPNEMHGNEEKPTSTETWWLWNKCQIIKKQKNPVRKTDLIRNLTGLNETFLV